MPLHPHTVTDVSILQAQCGQYHSAGVHSAVPLRRLVRTLSGELHQPRLYNRVEVLIEFITWNSTQAKILANSPWLDTPSQGLNYGSAWNDRVFAFSQQLPTLIRFRWARISTARSSWSSWPGSRDHIRYLQHKDGGLQTDCPTCYQK